MRRRIFMCLSALFVLVVAGGATALFCLNVSISQLSTLAESQRLQILRTDLASSAVRIETDLVSYAAGRPLDAVRRRDTVSRFRATLNRCLACHHVPAVQAQLDDVLHTFGRYEAAVERLLDVVHTPDAPVLEREANLVADELTRKATAMADQAAHTIYDRRAEVETSINHAWRTLWGTLLIVVVVGGLLAWHLQHRLIEPVNALMLGIQRMRDGAPDCHVEVQGDAEFRALGAALNDAHDSLVRARESVVQAEKMAAVGKLAAGVAHEVGNPLASISAIAQMMRRRCDDDPEQSERVDLIMRHVARVSQTVRELLTFSRPASAGAFGPVDISLVLNDTLSLVRWDKRVGGAQVATDVAPGLTIARGNADRLLMVFTNVVLNAFDAIAARTQGAGCLSVTAAARDGHVVVLFADNGPGMTPEHVASAFDPFFTTKDPGLGTGLGLWVCYHEIERHGGQIRIESRVGQGTTVTIEIPQNAPPPRSESRIAPPA